MKESRSVTYSEIEIDIVEKGGVPAINDVLFSGTDEEKERLLFCLDRYLDPWFKFNLPYEKEIVEALQKVITQTNSLEVKDDAIRLLIDFGIGPFLILEEYQRSGMIEPELAGDLNYLLTH